MLIYKWMSLKITYTVPVGWFFLLSSSIDSFLFYLSFLLFVSHALFTVKINSILHIRYLKHISLILMLVTMLYVQNTIYDMR